MLARKARFVMTGAAVVIGVSFIAGTFMLTDSINAAFKKAITEPAASRDVTVRERSAFKSTGVVSVDVQRGPVPDGLVGTISQVPGVKVAAGAVQGYAQLVGKDGKAIRAENAPMIGTNWIPEPELSLSRLSTGHGPIGGDQIAVDAQTFRRHGFHLGDRVTVLSTHAPRQFTIVGSLVFLGSGSPAGATVVAFDGPTAQAMVGRPGAWDEIEVAGARPGMSAGALAQRISDALPPQYEATTAASVAAALAKSVQSSVGRLLAILLVFAGIAVFAGVFIVYDTFSILVAQRSRELALLLAVGASRAQVACSVVAEAAAVGVMASFLGLGMGALVALGMQRAFTAAGFGLPASGLHVAARTVAVSAVVGTIVTVVSASIPAHRASRNAPVAALTDRDQVEVPSSSHPSAGGVVIGGAGLVLLAAGLARPPRTALVGLGSALDFIALAMISPRLIVPLAKVIGAPARAWGGVTGQLSHENAMRNPRRSAAMAAALVIGVAVMAVIATIGASVKATSARTIHDSLRADYVVSIAGGGFLTGSTLDGFSSDLAAQLRSRPELADVAEKRAGFWHRGSSLEYLSAVDAAVAPRVLDLRIAAGSLASLGDGQVLVDASVAQRLNLRVGGPITMGFDATGPQNLIVGGTFKSNEFVESFVISLGTYEANYPKGALDQQLFILDRASSSRAISVIKQVTDSYPNLEVQSPLALKVAEQHRLATVINLGYVLMAFSFMIALIGIVDTLALSVIERTRELGLLRAVGMHRSQVRRMVRGEAVQVCLIGAIIGIVVGTGLGLALVSSISFGTYKVVRVPMPTLIAVVVLAGLAAVVAAILPARRAASLDVLDAIAMT